MAFRFRQFVVEDDRSTMPVGTDAMLLGAWTDSGTAARILDLGTGCGVLALMMAQRSQAQVHAIDIDNASVEQALTNFSRSPWSERLTARCISAMDLAQNLPGTFDLIVSNPPFFSRSLRSPSYRKNLARHDTGLTRDLLITSVCQLLAPGGIFAVIVPASGFPGFRNAAAENGLIPEQILQVRSFNNTDPFRVLTRFSNCARNVTETRELIIFEAPGKFSGEYLELTSVFHYF